MYEYLKRKIDNSSKYDNLITNSACNIENLGKGDTFKTLDLMKRWTNETSHQTLSLSKQIKGRNLAETTANIQKFLYNNIQYKADKVKQKLLSPSCTWKIRKKGVDCKSFSIFGGSLLLNNNINFYFKKIVQGNDTNYSHVYIIVPINQNKNTLDDGYYVVDGTIKEQIEVDYIKSKITYMTAEMPHYGLKAPEDNRAKTILSNFQLALNKMLDVGFDKTQVTNFKNVIKYYTDLGIDPIIKKANRGFFVQNTYVPISKSGLNGSDNDNTSDDATSEDDDGDFFSELFENIDFGSFIDNIFSHPSCWGGTNIDNDVELEAITNAVNAYFNEFNDNEINIRNLNNLYKEVDYFLNHVRTHQRFHANESNSRCNKEKNNIQADLCIEYLAQLDSKLENLQNQGYTAVKTAISTTSDLPFFDVNKYTNKNLNHWKGTTQTINFNSYSFTYTQPSQDVIINDNSDSLQNSGNGNNDSEKKTNYAPLLIGAGVLAKLFGVF